MKTQQPSQLPLPSLSHLVSRGFPQCQCYTRWTFTKDGRKLPTPAPAEKNKAEFLTLSHALDSSRSLSGLTRKPSRQHLDGIGIVFAGTEHDLICLDLDTPTAFIPNSPLAQQADEFLAAHPTYIEHSPSGGGKRHAYYFLPNRSTLKYRTKPKQVEHLNPQEPKKSEKIELQWFLTEGYVTITGQDAESSPGYAPEIATITKEALLEAFPWIKQQQTTSPSNVFDLQSGQPTQPQQTLPNPEAIPPLASWVRVVPLDAGHPKVQEFISRHPKLDGYRDYWLFGLMCLKAAGFDPTHTEAAAREWSQKDPDPTQYDEQSFKDTWRSISPTGDVTVRSYLYLYKRCAPPFRLHPKGYPMWEMENVGKALEFLRIRPYRDMLTDTSNLVSEDTAVREYFKKHIQEMGGELHATMIHTPVTAIMRDWLGFPTVVPTSAEKGIKDLLLSQAVPGPSKMAKEFAKVKWDGKDRLTWLCEDYWILDEPRCTYPLDMYPRLLRKFFYAAARAIFFYDVPPKYQQASLEGMPVFSEKVGGIGKSYFMRMLVPHKWKGTKATVSIDVKYFTTANLKSRDILVEISGAAMGVIDELSAFSTKHSREDFYKFITDSPLRTARILHSDLHATYPCPLALYGATNADSLPFKEAGARRFWWFPVKSTLYRQSEEAWQQMWDDDIDGPQLWAQTWQELQALLADNPAIPPWHLTEEEREILNSSSSKIMETPATERFADWLNDHYLMTPESWCAARQGATTKDFVTLGKVVEQYQNATGHKLSSYEYSQTKEAIIRALKQVAPKEYRFNARERSPWVYGYKKASGQHRVLMPMTHHQAKAAELPVSENELS